MKGRTVSATCACVVALVVVVTVQSMSGVVEQAERDAVLSALTSRLNAGYVLPDSVDRITRALTAANARGEYTHQPPKDFVDSVNRTLLKASADKHLAIYFQPAVVEATPAAGRTASIEPRERMNFGFGRLERLSGNIGYLEILAFADRRPEAERTASALLSTLANFDALILDVRRNGGGNTPMMAFVASYFFDAAPVHLSDIFWRDTGDIAQFWTEAVVPGRRSSRQPLYILTSAQTFSGAEDFCYALQHLKRAVLVGETTGGGAHSGRGLQRLTPSFTAFVPVGRSVSPITHTNWEGTGVVPDARTPAGQALGVAHLSAVRALLERETDAQWKPTLQRLLDDLSRAPRQ